jgi:hypothetical protein
LTTAVSTYECPIVANCKDIGSIYVPYMSGHKYIQWGRGVVYTCVFIFGKQKIGLNLR